MKLLSDGKFRSESFGWPWDSGDTAVLEADNLTLVVGTRPVSLFDRSWFFAHGQDPRRFDLVVVKSPHCEHHMFAAWCARLINVDAPGSTSAKLENPWAYEMPKAHLSARRRGRLCASRGRISSQVMQFAF